MDYNAFKTLVMDAIASHDGDLSWYQLDRLLVWVNPEMSASLMPALAELEKEGKIFRVEDANSSQPRYTRSPGV
jgi:hypothetical protein